MMIRLHRVHNINMVTPDHFFPHVLELVSLMGHDAGNLPGMEWHSYSHTNSLIPFFAKGRHAFVFKRISWKHEDIVKGKYIDNTDIGKILIRLLR